MTSVILQSGWTNEACSGPPAIMIHFEDKNTSWSPMFAKHRANYAADICGESPIPMANGCCISAIEADKNQYGSTTHSLDGIDSIPKSAVGSTYCHYTSQKDPILYDEMFILNDGYCYEKSFQCMNDTLWIYNPSTQGSCIGKPMQIPLNDTIQIRSTPVGLISANMVTIAKGEVEIGWTTYTPSNLLTPESDSISYPLGIMFTFMAIFGTLLVGTFYSYRFYKGRTVFMLAYMLSQFLWLTWIILDAYLLYSLFPDMKWMNVFQRLQKAWLGIATLMSVFITANILLIFMKKYSLRNQLLFMFALVVLHFALSGALYITDNIPTVWSRMTAVWIIFMYFFDITPPLFVFCSLLKSMPKPRTAKNLIQLHNYDRFVGILLMLQVINACWFGSMVYVTQYTAVLKNDRNYLSMGGPFAFSFVFHSIVSCVLNHHIRYMLSLGAQLETVKTKSNHRSGRGQDLPMIRTDFPDAMDGPDSDHVLLPHSAYTPTTGTPKPFSDLDTISVTSESEYRSGMMFGLLNEPMAQAKNDHLISPMNEKSLIAYQTLRSHETDSSNRSVKTSLGRKDRIDPYKSFRTDPAEVEPKRKNTHLQVDTSSSTLTPYGKHSPSLSPMQGYKSLERPRSTYSSLFEANKERSSSHLPIVN